MCSVSDDIEDLSVSVCSCEKQAVTVHVQPLTIAKCRKCGEPPVILLQKKDPFCKTCFLMYCNHKFKSTIGKTKSIKPGHKVLIAASGGSKSIAMLEMIVQALQDASHKKLLFIPGILYINENILNNSGGNDDNEILTSLSKRAKMLNVPLLFSSLSMVFRENNNDKFFWESRSIVTKEEKECLQMLNKKLMQCLNNTTSLSSKQDYVEHLRLVVMTDIAHQAAYSHLFVGDSADDVACKMLSHIALGRGSQVPSNTGFCDMRYKVPVCRPMREFLNKEIAFFNHLTDNATLSHSSLLTKTGAQSSIQRLTESFIYNLQENFPATVFTIFRTGGKVSSSSEPSYGTCIMCKSFRDNSNPDPCSAIELLSVSENVSKPHVNSHNADLVNTNVEAPDVCKILQQYLCHACQVVLDKTDLGANIPPLQLKETLKKANRDEMKTVIKDFILEDE